MYTCSAAAPPPGATWVPGYLGTWEPGNLPVVAAELFALGCDPKATPTSKR